MQVYNEQVYDLLNDENNKKMVALSIRESNTERGKNLYVQGLSEYRVGSEEDVLQVSQEKRSDEHQQQYSKPTHRRLAPRRASPACLRSFCGREEGIE